MKTLKKLIPKLLISLAVIAVVIVGGYFLLKAFGLNELSKDQIQTFVESTGALAPITFIFVTFLQVTFIPIPSTVTILLGNYLFGPWLAYLYSFIGLLIGSILAFFLGRWIGKPYLTWLAGGKEELDGWFKRFHGREKVVLFFMFLFPFFPDDFLCSIAGALPITFAFFLFSQIVTRIIAIGGNLLFLSGEVIAYEGVGLVIVIALIAIGVTALILSLIYSEKLNGLFDKFIAKITRKRKVENEEVHTEKN